jgi:hypothetical protein
MRRYHVEPKNVVTVDKNTGLRKILRHNANFVEYGYVRNVFVKEKDIILELERVILSDIKFAIDAMINF